MPFVPDVAVRELAGVFECLCFAELPASLYHYRRGLNDDHVPFYEVVGNHQAHVAILSFESLNVPEHEFLLSAQSAGIDYQYTPLILKQKLRATIRRGRESPAPRPSI